MKYEHDQQDAQEKALATAKRLAIQRDQETRRISVEGEFRDNKTDILGSALRAFEEGDAQAARRAIARFGNLTDPDLARLRNRITLAELRAELERLPTQERRDAIYVEIARLDPFDAVAVAQANSVARGVINQRGRAAVAPQEPPSVGSCSSEGHAIATVYFANLKAAMEAGMIASEMMEKGCQQAVGNRGPDCVNQCISGFKAKAKQWVKN